MIVLQIFENKSLILTQLVKQIPSIEENVKIKGRKGKVISVKEIENNLYHVQIAFEQVIKAPSKVVLDPKKRKR